MSARGAGVPVQESSELCSAPAGRPAPPDATPCECAGSVVGPELATALRVTPCRDFAPCTISFPVSRIVVSKLAYAAAMAVVVGALWASGYPGWRVAVLAATYVAHALFEGLLLSRVPRTADRSKVVWERGLGRGPTFAHAVTFALTGTQLAMTGGLASPLVVAYAVPFLAGVALLGSERRTAVVGACTVAVAAALAALPGAWAGPRVPSPAFELIVLSSLFVAVVVTGTNLSVMVRALHDAHEALLRSREQAARAALARARHLEQVGSTVAHELKNPLTAVKALVQLGARNPAEGASRDRLETVEREVTRMQEILQDYLSFSRPLGPLAPEPVDLSAVAENVLASVSGRAEQAGVALGLSGAAAVQADPRRVEEALLNLVVNAVEATPRGGRVEIELARADGQAAIRVHDTGRGMSPEVLARIGTPFFTTREDGTGLGVVLAKGAFVQHGGSLRFESAPGVGTTAIATLPVRAAGRGDGPHPARG